MLNTVTVTVTWLGTEAETSRLLDAVHASSTCCVYASAVGTDCCEVEDGAVVCTAHAMLSSQVALDVCLALMRSSS